MILLTTNPAATGQFAAFVNSRVQGTDVAAHNNITKLFCLKSSLNDRMVFERIVKNYPEI